MRRGLLLLSVLLAGCVEAPPGEPSLIEAASGPFGEALARLGDANAWLAERWAGGSEILLVEASFSVGPGVSTGEQCVPSCGGFLASPEEVLVPPGTEAIVVTAEWAEPPGAPARLRLIYDSGGSAQPIRETIARGVPFEIPVGAADADAPFQAHSHWWFAIRALNEPGVATAIDVTATIVARRAAELPVLSAPSDPWATGAPQTLVSGTPLSNARLGGPTGAFCRGCEGFAWSSAAGGIVAPGAARVQATLTWDWEGPTRGGVVAWSPVSGEIPMTEVERGDRHVVLEAVPTGNQFDSPWQTKSLWWFFLVVNTAGAPAQVSAGEASLEAVALAS